MRMRMRMIVLAALRSLEVGRQGAVPMQGLQALIIIIVIISSSNINTTHNTDTNTNTKLISLK